MKTVLLTECGFFIACMFFRSSVLGCAEPKDDSLGGGCGFLLCVALVQMVLLANRARIKYIIWRN